jgi:adenylate kinase family enzyme
VQLLTNDETCIKRISGRQVCNQCFQVYNRKTVLSKTIDKCDHCHAPLALRKADTNEIAEQRLRYFHENIEPLFHNLNLINQHYHKLIINADQPLSELHSVYDNLITNK